MGVFFEAIKSPNLKPTMYSLILNLIKFLPLYINKSNPTKDGSIEKFFIFLKKPTFLKVGSSA